jgi:hypothetical protein
VGAVDHTKGIIDVFLGPSSQLADEIGIILGFSLPESQVFQQEQFAGLEGIDPGSDFGSDTIVGKTYLLIQQRG